MRSTDSQVNCCVTSGVTFILESNLLQVRQDEMESLVVTSPKQVTRWVFVSLIVCILRFFLLVVL